MNGHILKCGCRAQILNMTATSWRVGLRFVIRTSISPSNISALMSPLGSPTCTTATFPPRRLHLAITSSISSRAAFGSRTIREYARWNFDNFSNPQKQAEPAHHVFLLPSHPDDTSIATKR